MKYRIIWRRTPHSPYDYATEKTYTLQQAAEFVHALPKALAALVVRVDEAEQELASINTFDQENACVD